MSALCFTKVKVGERSNSFHDLESFNCLAVKTLPSLVVRKGISKLSLDSGINTPRMDNKLTDKIGLFVYRQTYFSLPGKKKPG